MSNGNKISPRGSSWNDFERQMYTPEEIAESKKRREIIEKLFSENHSDFFKDTILGLFEAAEIKLGRSLTVTEMQNIINEESITYVGSFFVPKNNSKKGDTKL